LATGKFTAAVESPGFRLVSLFEIRAHRHRLEREKAWPVLSQLTLSVRDAKTYTIRCIKGVRRLQHSDVEGSDDIPMMDVIRRYLKRAPFIRPSSNGKLGLPDGKF